MTSRTMYAENDRMANQVAEMAKSACAELFGAYGVKLSAEPGPWATTDTRLYSGVMGFVGSNIRGTCLLVGEPAPLEATCPKEGRLRDWVGELANQLVGRLKLKLLSRGVAVTLTTPVVFTGVRVEPLPRSTLLPHVFSSPHGGVLVWLEVESAAGLALGSERPNQAGAEGDILLF